MAAATNTDLAMLLPDLLHDADRILIDGPAKVDAALAHYLVWDLGRCPILI
jgi:hypothetical protein